MRKHSLIVAFAAFAFAATLMGADEAIGGYIPDKAFITQMTTLLEKTSVESYSYYGSVMAMKELKVGASYKAGEVAYFFLIVDPSLDKSSVLDMGMQLEEWKLLDNGNFRVTISNMSPYRMIRWSITVTADGTIVLGSMTPEEKFSPDSPEAVETSERTQTILRRAGDRT